ncbi:MAG: DUF2065 domain-containing protein [Thiothrix sp.]|nr:DUF2065 domain-containing protein [Thiothrix sp.]HPE61217.1 DUF2065 domain-containing protein [Thiolinea sp.]
MNFGWQDFLNALALLFILEGLLPFMAPGRVKNLYLQLASHPEKNLRRVGLASMLAGILLLLLTD